MTRDAQVPMPSAPRVVALSITLALSTGACVAGLGATAGLAVDSSGNTALVARGWMRSGSWLNKDKSNDKRAQWGMTLIPTSIELGVGYDLSRCGLRLEGALPVFGLVRAPLDESGQVISGVLGARFAATVLDKRKDHYFTISGYTSFSVSSVRSFDREGSDRSDWDDPRAYRTLGLRVDLGIGGGSAWGNAFVGPAFEYLDFYHIYLSEGPQEPDPGA